MKITDYTIINKLSGVFVSFENYSEVFPRKYFHLKTDKAADEPFINSDKKLSSTRCQNSQFIKYLYARISQKITV